MLPRVFHAQLVHSRQQVHVAKGLPWLSWLEHPAVNREVAGSSPAGRALHFLFGKTALGLARQRNASMPNGFVRLRVLRSAGYIAALLPHMSYNQGDLAALGGNGRGDSHYSQVDQFTTFKHINLQMHWNNKPTMSTSTNLLTNPYAAPQWVIRGPQEP